MPWGTQFSPLPWEPEPSFDSASRRLSLVMDDSTHGHPCVHTPPREYRRIQDARTHLDMSMCAQTHTRRHKQTDTHLPTQAHTHTHFPHVPSTRLSLPPVPRVLGPARSPTPVTMVTTPVGGTGGAGAGCRGHRRPDTGHPPAPQSVPIISHSRWLLKQGELQQMSGPKTSRTLRTKKLFREIYLCLFNDLLVICRQIPG